MKRQAKSSLVCQSSSVKFWSSCCDSLLHPQLSNPHFPPEQKVSWSNLGTNSMCGMISPKIWSRLLIQCLSFDIQHVQQSFRSPDWERASDPSVSVQESQCISYLLSDPPPLPSSLVPWSHLPLSCKCSHFLKEPYLRKQCQAFGTESWSRAAGQRTFLPHSLFFMPSVGL